MHLATEINVFRFERREDLFHKPQAFIRGSMLDENLIQDINMIIITLDGKICAADHTNG